MDVLGDIHSEDAEDQKDDTARPILAREEVDGCRKAEDDVEYARNPNELLGEGTSQPNISITKHNRDGEAKDEEDDGVCVEAEVVSAVKQGPMLA